MPPRFTNPHLLPTSLVSVSRKDIRVEENELPGHKADPLIVNQLHELLLSQWEPITTSEPKSRKRRRVQNEHPEEPEREDSSISFRLLSSSRVPRPIILQYKPPPPQITREPDAEDNDHQAALREERARRTAVDASLVLKESCLKGPPYPGDARKLKQLTAVLPSVPPTLMIIEHDKPSRSTRPPVPPSYLLQHPYKQGPVSPSIPRPKYPLIQLSLSTMFKAGTLPKRRRRRKKVSQEKERPPPVYWRPDPAVGGKSLGYAMGFPCSLQALQSGINQATRYCRDTMREAATP